MQLNILNRSQSYLPLNRHVRAHTASLSSVDSKIQNTRLSHVLGTGPLHARLQETASNRY